MRRTEWSIAEWRVTTFKENELSASRYVLSIGTTKELTSAGTRSISLTGSISLARHTIAVGTTVAVVATTVRISLAIASTRAVVAATWRRNLLCVEVILDDTNDRADMDWLAHVARRASSEWLSHGLLTIRVAVSLALDGPHVDDDFFSDNLQRAGLHGARRDFTWRAWLRA